MRQQACDGWVNQQVGHDQIEETVVFAQEMVEAW
jgi:hypothetical protein